MELVDGMPLDRFGLVGPDQLPCLSLRYHVVQKIHGMTRPSTEAWRNDRERDLIDLLLLEELVTDYDALREACAEVFAFRAQHNWPPTGVPPAKWAEAVMALVREYEIPVESYGMATTRVRNFIRRIDETGPGQ